MIVLKAIELEGFRSFRERAVIRFPERGAILIRGHYTGREVSSGSGKSTVLLGVSFALGFCPIPATELKNWDSKSMRVALTLKDTETGLEWTIVRDPKLSIITPDRTVTAGADETLRQILRTDPELAAALTYREQRKPGNFINKTDAQKKEFLTVLLSLGQIEKALEDFDAEIKNIESKRVLSESIISGLEMAIPQNLVTPEQVELARVTYQQAMDKFTALSNAVTNESQIRNEDAQIRSELGKIRQLNIQAQVAGSRNQSIRSQVMALTGEIDKLKASICPTCLREWDSCGHLVEQKSQQIQELLAQMQQNLIVIENNKTYASAEPQLQARLVEIVTILTRMSAPLADAVQLQRTTLDYYNELRTKKQNYDNMMEGVNEARAEKAKAEDELALTQAAIAILGREGFLGSIFDEVLLDIETRTNTMISQISNTNGFTISFPSTKVTQKGKATKSITTELHKSGKKVSPKAISGGQSCTVELCSDLATCEAIRSRSGSPLGWIALDEAMDGLDVEPKREALEVIRQNVGGQIFVIDHATEIKDGFEKVIEIEYDGKESHVVGG